MLKLIDFNQHPEIRYVKEMLERNLGAFYIFYFLENKTPEKSIAISSLPEWSDLYTRELIKKCPIKNRADLLGSRTKGNYVLPWRLCHPIDSQEIDIILLRREFDIGTGLSFCRRNFNQSNEFFAVAPFKKDSIAFTDKILNDSELTLESAISTLRTFVRETLIKEERQLKII